MDFDIFIIWNVDDGSRNRGFRFGDVLDSKPRGFDHKSKATYYVMEPCITINTLLWVQVTVWGEINQVCACERKHSTSKFAHTFNYCGRSKHSFLKTYLMGLFYDFLVILWCLANTIMSQHRKWLSLCTLEQQSIASGGILRVFYFYCSEEDMHGVSWTLSLFVTGHLLKSTHQILTGGASF